MSQRSIARFLKISKHTVAKKFEFIAAQALIKNAADRMLYKKNLISEVYLDEMEDRIHTKCKPVSIALVVTKGRKILGHETSRIRPKTRRLRELSEGKYPHWTPNSVECFGELIKKIVPFVTPEVSIYSDKKKSYPKKIKSHLPLTRLYLFESRRAVIAGQGELKEGGKDPLFPINHTCAMLRANINRLIRRTWCTSKKIEALHKHIEIYTLYHNRVLT